VSRRPNDGDLAKFRKLRKPGDPDASDADSALRTPAGVGAPVYAAACSLACNVKKTHHGCERPRTTADGMRALILPRRDSCAAHAAGMGIDAFVLAAQSVRMSCVLALHALAPIRDANTVIFLRRIRVGAMLGLPRRAPHLYIFGMGHSMSSFLVKPPSTR